MIAGCGYGIMVLQAFLWLAWPTLIQCKDSEIAPPRRGGRGVKSFSKKKLSKLCELCVSAVNTLSQ
jgi:hypothetical protein